jgi:hypothetical protein
MFRSPARVAAVVLVLSLVIGYGFAGSELYRTFVGLDPSGFPAGQAIQDMVQIFRPDLRNAVAGTVWAALAILALGVLGFFSMRSAVRSRAAAVDPGRRSFLTGAGSGALVGVGSMLAAGAGAASRALFGVGTGAGGWAPVGEKIMDRDMTFTSPDPKESWKGSHIVLGTGRIQGENGEQIARLALDRGVNYFDTSPDYSGSGSENAMGKAIQGRRDGLFIATKFCTPAGHLPRGASVEEYKTAVEGSLRRLGTDYVDLCHVHSVDDVGRLLDPNVHEAFDQLKQEGKVRFLGFSTHTPKLVEVANAAIDSGRFDVMMLAYHHGLWAQIPEIMERARKEQDMGVVAMKTLKGAKQKGLQDFQPYAESFPQAALKWALSNPSVSCAVISFFELQHVDEYLRASGKPLRPDDVAILEEYDRQIAGSYCGPHCGECLGSCPEGLPIHDVLRHRMYFEDYGWEKEGIQRYSQLEKNASVCAGCSAPCMGSCPVGVPIQERMTGAHQLLSLS